MREEPRLSPRKEAERAARAARLGAALRDNLRRRKEQHHAREPGPEVPDDPSPGLSGTALPSKSGCRGADRDEG